MKKLYAAVIVCSFIFLNKTFAQHILPEKITLGAPGVINFKELAQKEAMFPQAIKHVDVEADEEKHTGIPKAHAVDHPNVTMIELSAGGERVVSPSPLLSFNGLTDDGTLIPPDVNGTAGPNHLMETINSQYRIFNKSGGTVSTLSLASFWSGISGTPFCDPHITYDPNSGKWYTVLLATLTSGHSGFFLAVSQTNDPTGSWWEYSVDAQGSGSTWMDYPAIGFNNNWIVVTGNMFNSNNTFNTTKIFVFNKTNVTSGTSGTVSSFSDAGIFSLEPAATYDAGINTEYMLTEWNNNSGGNCYVKIYTIGGTQSAPTYNAGAQVGTNQPYSVTEKDAPQLGISNKIATNDTRMRSVIYRNGSLYGAQTVFLPSSSPNRAACQVWQINPSTSTLQQFFRVDDASAATFYAFPSVSVNTNNDMLVGYSVFSSSIYGSSGYSYRTSTDASNTLQSNYTYKGGQATYYKTYGGPTNRWGDYTGTSVDPNDGSIWTVQEFAYTPSNTWGTVWAQVAASSSGGTCNVPSGLSASSITSSSATLSWGSVSGAVSYSVRYKPTSSGTWTTSSTSSTSLAVTGLTANTQYEFQVQTVCSSGSSAYSASTNFTTLSSGGIVYCASNGTDQTYEWIDYVALGTIARSSGSDAGYYDGSALSTNVSTGSNYTLTFSAGFSGSVYSETWAVYVDWNHDGDFTDAGETAFTGTSSGSGNNTATIAVPSTATIASTRMRVSMEYNATPPSCGSYTYGEVEDYTLNIQTGTSTCTNSYEPNDTKNSAAAIAVNTDILSQIATSTDNDWFSFANTSSQKNIKVTMTTLPADFDMRLYNPSGTQVGISQNGGTSDETIIYNTSTVGTYKIKVYGYKSAYSNTACYTLRASISSTQFKLDEGLADNGQKSEIVLYPVPASNSATVTFSGDEDGTMDVTIFNSLGVKIYTGVQNINAGPNHFNLDLGKFTNGVYFLQLMNNDGSWMKQFEVSR